MTSTSNSVARRFAAATFAAVLVPLALAAQDGRYRGIAVGNVPDVAGIRINFRDSDLRRVDGINITLWSPYEPSSGHVRGIALGLPLTGAENITGIATGVFGAGADRNLTGIAIAPIGVGAGKNVKGIAMGGVGIGAGGDLTGIMVGGIGAGAGGDAHALLISGIGAGVGGSLRGIAIAGIGVGAGGSATGALIAGVGAGVGGDFKGIGVGGVGMGIGGNTTGLLIGGIGAGIGGRMRGAAIGGLGVGASEIDGIAIGGLGVGAGRAKGLVLTGGILRIEKEGTFRGFSANAAGSMIKGRQKGVVIGLVNYARSVRGLQIGLINIIDGAQSHRVLPFINWED